MMQHPPPCNCGVSKCLRTNHEADYQAAYRRSTYVGPRKFLTREELEKLTTKRLLAYKSKLYKVPEGPSYEETIYGGRDLAMHKQLPEWQSAVNAVKVVLSVREHIGGPE